MKPIRLGVNVDHVATIREARGTQYPDPVFLAQCAEQAGADGITIHLREDRRHIQDDDLSRMKDSIMVPLNLECAVTSEMLAIACEIKPDFVCLVPERREELTTEGGLDVLGQETVVASAVQRLQEVGIKVSLFIDPDVEQIRSAAKVGADIIELHTGRYAETFKLAVEQEELTRITDAANYAANQGLVVNAGHGLHYHNVIPIANIAVINELNIGHAIIAKSLHCGMSQAVVAMRELMDKARNRD